MLKSLQVLYIEDEDNIRELMYEVLHQEFKRFETAADALEGLEKFEKKEFDIVITDIEMPRIDGLELAKKIRERSREIPILLLTAYSEKERLINAIKIGVNRYLIKPFGPQKLLEEVCDIAKERCKQIVPLSDGLTYNYETKEVIHSQASETLTKKEARFFEYLLQNSHRVVTVEELKKILWSEKEFSEDALRALVKRVRRKSSKSLIKNYPRIGYKIILS